MSAKNPGRSGVPDWLIERLAAGELPPERAAEVERRLALEPGGRARLAAIAVSNAEILAAHPVPDAAASITRRIDTKRALERARRPSRVPWSFRLAAPALAAVALLVVVRFRGGLHPDNGTIISEPDGLPTGERPKGNPRLNVYRKTGRNIERLHDGAFAHAGDELQLAYIAAGKRYGAVLSLDGAGKITFHLPSSGGDASVALSTEGEVSLPESYQLDAAPGFERFLMVVSNEPFSTTSLRDVIRDVAPPPAGAKAITITLRKN